MGKHSKKRQRTATDDDASNMKPLGSVVALAGDDDKDGEEKRLEALLFGTTFPSSTVAQLGLNEDEAPGITNDENGGLDHLLDSDVRCHRFSR